LNLVQAQNLSTRDSSLHRKLKIAAPHAVESTAGPTPARYGAPAEYRLQARKRLTGFFLWPSLQQVCRLTRSTCRAGKWTTEIVYTITSVTKSLGSAAGLLRWWRGRWGIENRSPYVRDVTIQEDAYRIPHDQLPKTSPPCATRP
jgi:hypothetical protein